MTERLTCRLLAVRSRGAAVSLAAGDAEWGGGSDSCSHTVLPCGAAGSSLDSSPASPLQDLVTTAAFEMPLKRYTTSICRCKTAT